jgi:hypothetical protein
MAVRYIKTACTALNRLASFQHLSKFLQDSSLTRFHIFSHTLLKEKIKNKDKEEAISLFKTVVGSNETTKI